jgi:hypothetical protein
MTESDNYNGKFEDFERVLIFDIDQTSRTKLIDSLERLGQLLATLPLHDTRAMWLNTRSHLGPRLNYMYWMPQSAEIEDAKNEQETLDVSVSLVQEGNLYIVEGKCVTDRLDGNIDQLFELVLGQIKEMKLRMIEDVSFSESISLEYQFMSDVLFRVYARK